MAAAPTISRLPEDQVGGTHSVPLKSKKTRLFCVVEVENDPLKQKRKLHERDITVLNEKPASLEFLLCSDVNPNYAASL